MQMFKAYAQKIIIIIIHNILYIYIYIFILLLDIRLWLKTFFYFLNIFYFNNISCAFGKKLLNNNNKNKKNASKMQN